MRLETYFVYYLSTIAITISHVDGFTNPALHSFRIRTNEIPSQISISSPKPSTSTCLNAFGLQTLKRILTPPPEDLTETQVRDLFLLWNQALLSGDSNKVAERYSSNPLLLPTVSDTPRTDYHGVKDYFDHFLKLQPCGEILEGKISCGPGWAQDAGIYQFTLGKDGSKLKARYSYVYVLEDGEWKIAHHHSSKMPEASSENTKTTTTISKEQVQKLFDDWANALETREADEVASLYAKDAVLLPTVSDIPRTDYEGIKDYFVHFLKLEPKGEIVESHVTCGDGWCENVGIYEFALGTTGETVRARYSFVYTQQDDGQWKILHHHSSKMPEATAPAKAHRLSEDQVRSLFDTWNDALLSLDPDQVTKLYSKNHPVLLPTVSDRPRYTYESIRDYFVHFLYQFPQGEILESQVTCGDDWCQNVGIYQFQLGRTGETILARYSFVYQWEDGEWKISHHHSSVLPEAMLEASKRLKELMEDKPIAAGFGATSFNHTHISP